MRQDFLNACIYAKQKIDLTWPKMLGLTFSSKLNWSFYIISIAKTAFKKIRALIRSRKFLSPDVALYIYISTIKEIFLCCKEPSQFKLLLQNIQVQYFERLFNSS